MRRKLNILIVTDIFPFPPSDGGKICVYGFIDSLRRVQNIHLFLPVYNAEQEDAVEAMKIIWSEVAIHTAREYIPEQDVNLKTKLFKTAKKTGKDAISFLENLRRKDASRVAEADYFGKIVSPQFSPNFIRNFSELLSEIEFDIVQAEYTPALNLVNVIPESAKKIFVEVESLYLLVKDYQKIPGADKSYVDYLSENAKIVELAYMSKYDAVFALSEFDEERLRHLLPGKKVYASSYPVLDKDIAEAMPEDFTIRKVVFMGGEQHPPNKDAILWFAEDILPLIDLSGDVKVYITGSWQAETKKRVSALSDKIIFTGFVEDVKPLLENSVSIAPIRLGGGGVRTKLLYAMAANSAIVTTSAASIGIIGKDEKAFLVADTAREFADAVNAVLNDARLSERLVKAGKKIIEKHYTQKVLAERRNNFYYEIVSN